MKGCHQELVLFLFLLLSMVYGDPELLPRGSQQITNFQTQQGSGGLLPFPEGRGPDGTLYKTDYRCEGENMTVSCLDSDGPGLHGTIQVVRGNFGRFSIAICNRHGQTDWSVNCMAPQTTNVLQKRCNGSKQCVVPVNSELFHDACPGTHKYLEIHYACLSSRNNPSRKVPDLPDWLKQVREPKRNTLTTETSQNPKNVPILVTGKVTTARPTPITTPTTTTTSMSTTRRTTSTASTTAVPSATSATKSINRTQKPSLVVRPTTQGSTLNTPSGPIVTPMTGATSGCQPVTARRLQWNWTPAGQELTQHCPIGATGFAKWYCVDTEGEFPQWERSGPDMSDCTTQAMKTLESEVRAEDPENVLVSKLAYLTRSKSLYGGDLEIVVNIMRTVADRIQYRLQSSSGNFHDKVNHIRQVLLNVLRSAANILEDNPDGRNRDAWRDLSLDSQMRVATSLMLALEENAFLLAGVTETPEEILETYETLTMTIKVASVLRPNYMPQIEFPAKPLLYVDDKVSLAASDLADNSHGGLGRAVFFSYRDLHGILQRAKTHLSFESAESSEETQQPWRLNSRIISASLGRGRHIELQKPVTITLRHLETDPRLLRDPTCVFWDYEVHGWSDAGCQLILSNQTFSVCQCDHLTNFGLLMRPVTNSPLMTHVRLDIVAYVVTSVVFLAICVLIFKTRSQLKSWCQNSTLSCYCCDPENGSSLDKERRNTSHLDKCQSFYTGLSQGPHPPPGYPKARTLGPSGLLTSGLTGASTTSRVPGNHHGFLSENGGLRTLNSTPLMMMSKPRPHITLNPYSTQLVDNLNMMMPNTSSSNSNSSASTNSTSLGNGGQNMSPQLMNLTNTLRRSETLPSNQQPGEDVIYRSVSPHGHVYWEIDPNQVYGGSHTNNNQFCLHNEESVALLSNNHQYNHPTISRPYLTSREGQLTEEDLLLQQHLLSSSDPNQTNGLHDSLHGLQHTNESNFHPGMVMMASSSNAGPRNNQQTNQQNNTQGSFVRTGANRFTRKKQQQVAQPQQTVATVSSVATSQASNVPEQLQTQVQIRDILPIQVSVKSSEYIEAKIRTLRKNNNFE